MAILEYTSGFLGVVLPPWVRIRDLVAVSTGALGIVAAVMAAAWVLKHDRWRKPLPTAMLGVMLFSLATALITALGRLGFGSSQAFQSRYQSYNLLFWFATATLWLLIADEGLPRLRTVMLMAMPVVMLLAAGLLFPLCLRAARSRISTSEAAAVTLLTGVPDKQALAVLYPDPSIPWRDAEYFREQKAFMFSGSQAELMAEPLVDVYRIGSADSCAGQVGAVERVPVEDLLTEAEPGGLRISGWAVHRPSGAPVRSLVIAADGKIAGFAVGGLQLVRTDKTFLRKQRLSEWSGSARLPLRAESLDIYGVVEENRICLIGTATVPLD